MTRKGRELEELVAILEKGLSGTDVKITSPDFIEDIVIEDKREVDVSLRFNMGSHDFLLVFECRDRKNTEDVTWIEQLATKRDDICVNKLIAVSSNGFSNNARKKAHAKNIELRTLKEIDPKEIFGWFQVTEIDVINLRWSLIRAFIVKHESLDTTQIDELKKFIKSLSGDFLYNNKFILDPKAEDVLSISDCVSYNSDNINRDFNPTEEKKIIQFKLRPQSEEDCFYISTTDTLIRIECIELELEIWQEFYVSKIVSPSSYDNEKKQLAQIVKFEDIEIGGVKKSLKTHLMIKDDKETLEFFLKDKG
ncbi:hypothetical protein MSBRW_0555 [Methanosarcina barkeri str. Wiesmoor]|uniref:Restriction endonuclease type IV Mrr domain-containing protein n=2 Tax=Methanosarcina barkeri TaxID=2208 RepID=A0A0E3QGU0_METBA|nr:restriction endonuclease [Methanosarcina barkeri]AKB49808.1 hypothetical protein MSBRW_0555 [Methanosarcina barkeri str. Wiesmoor]